MYRVANVHGRTLHSDDLTARFKVDTDRASISRVANLANPIDSARETEIDIVASIERYVIKMSGRTRIYILDRSAVADTIRETAAMFSRARTRRSVKSGIRSRSSSIKRRCDSGLITSIGLVSIVAACANISNAFPPVNTP